MGNGATGGIYIGCSTDRRFVDPTCAMLSSLEDNGGLPEAVILVADFGLDESDRVQLRDSAGHLGTAMRFVPLDRTSPKIVALPDFEFPLPLLGRFVLPGEIAEPGARLLLVDSDMVINDSLRPLFDLDMAGRSLAAIQDPLMMIEYRHHRKRSPVYLNAGLMLIDVDRFTARSIGEAAMRKLASYKRSPIYLDQCALNEVLDGDWLEINRTWNFFQTGYGRHFEHGDYDAARVIHFAGPKPWEVDFHPATAVWNHHATRAQEKRTAWRLRADRDPVDRVFVAMLYRIFLGRELEAEAIVIERAALSRCQATAIMIEATEFRDEILKPLVTGASFASDRFADRLDMATRYWVADQLAILPKTACAALEAATWRDLLAALVRDGRLMGLAGLDPVET